MQNKAALINIAFPTTLHTTITNKILATHTPLNKQVIAESELSWKTIPTRFRATQEYANDLISSLRVYGEEQITDEDDYQRRKPRSPFLQHLLQH